jgi:hypothetical protein
MPFVSFSNPRLRLAPAGVASDLLRAERREVLFGAAVTTIVAVVLLAWGPAPGDAPAHLYRTLLVREGSFVWDNFWYSGNYPLASYSLLYYLPAAVFGNLPIVVGAAVASTVLFGSISLRQWGDTARWPTRAFGVLAGPSAVTRAPHRTGALAHGLADILAYHAGSGARGRRTETAQTAGVVVCGKYDMLLVAARSLHQDPLMVSLMPLLQRVPPATPGNFPLS